MKRFNSIRRLLHLKLKKYWYTYNFHIWIARLKHITLGDRKRKVISIIAGAFVIVASVYTASQSNVQALQKLLDANDFMLGTTQYGEVQLSSDRKTLSLQPGSVGSWDQSTTTNLQLLPSQVYGSTAMDYGPNNSIYYVSNFGNTCTFTRYDVERRDWLPLESVPIGCASGTNLVYNGTDAFYYMPGGNSAYLFRYDIAADSWKRLADIPAQVGGISNADFVDRLGVKSVYVFRGGGSSSFWRYDVANNTWVSVAAFPNSGSVSNGIAMTWDGADGIYALANHTGEFQKYSINSNSWSDLGTYSMSNRRSTLAFTTGKLYASSVRTNTEETFMSVYSTSSGLWNEYESPSPATQRDWPSPIAYDGSRYIYTQVGTENRQQMYRFDTTTNSWNGTQLFTLSGGDDWHHSLIYDGDKSAYYAAGTASNNFSKIYKYDLTTNQTQQIGNQYVTNSGFKGVHYGGSLYLLSNRDPFFQKFDVSTGTFTMLENAPFQSNWGADIIDGGDGYLYVTFGGRTNFYRYSPSTDTWQVRTSLINSSIYTGGGITRIGRTIYALHGNSTGFFSSYNMDTNTWSANTQLPSGKVDHGGWITSDGSRYVYVGLGTRADDHNRRIYRYDTTNSTWQRMADLPASADLSANAFYDSTNSKLYLSQGYASSNLWKWSPGTSAYVTSGTWYSKALDLKQVEAWGSLDTTIGGTGATTVYTRTSQTGKLWTDWQIVSNGNIASPKNRYVQLKILLSGSGTATPTISDIKVNYTQETTAPTLPAQLTVKSKEDGDVLTSGQTYEWQHPYISWSGASDGANGSGVKGYYVYYGTNSGADPVTDGAFQTSTNYTVTKPMQAGEVYYVRIKVVDNLGNISNAATFFSYRYFYLSPPGTQTKTSDSDFSAGNNTNVSIQSGSMSLKHADDGKWSTGSIEALPEKVRASASAVVDDHLYTMRGAGSTTFWRYNTISRSWETLAPLPDTVSDGSALTWDGNNFLYAFRGNGSNDFYRYDIQNNSWETLPSLPAAPQQGSDIAYVGNGKLAVFFTGIREFYTYDVSSRLFVAQESYPNSITYGGSGIWYDGNDSLYAYLGSEAYWLNSDNSRQMFVKYSISTDTWKTLEQPPVAALRTQNNLVGDGHGGLYFFSNNENNNTSRSQLMFRYDLSTNLWSEIEGLNSRVDYGSATTDNKRYLYIMPSGTGNSSMLIRYDTWDKTFSPNVKNIDKWERMSWDWPSNAWTWQSSDATSAVYDGSKFIYALGRGESAWSHFVRFNPSTGETKYLPPPYYVARGDSLAFIDGELYFTRARSTGDFYRFDMANQEWDRMTDVPSAVYQPGSTGLIGTGSSGYLLRGNSSFFYQYNPNGSGGNWTRKPDAPGSVRNGSTVYDEANGYIYVIRGNNTSDFYRYSIASDSWSTLSSLPLNTTYGSSMVLNNGKIFAVRGEASNDMFVYDIASNTWTSSTTPAPDTANYSATLVGIDSSHALFLPAGGSTDIWKFVYPTATTAYHGYSEHESEVFTVTGMFDYAGIESSVNIPPNTKIEYWTRSSDDSTNWDEWKITNQVKYFSGNMSARVASEPKKYTQIKVKLYSLDNVFTPTVNDYKLNYYFDVDPPQNPTSLDAYSNNTKTAPVASDTWYNHSQPTFDWPEPGEPSGPTDGPLGSNLRGYWVYVGMDETAVPRTAGVFVEGQTEYTPTLSVSGTYFFRMQAEDMTGNVDPAIYSPFKYKFDNTAPTNPSLITVTPGGYSTRNNYTYEWPSSFDAHSGISGYCYHTGATGGAFGTEICQSGRELRDVPTAYRTGTNVFYLRTIDSAGNYSNGYTTVSYYYTTDPPSPPTNLRAIPPTQYAESFCLHMGCAGIILW